MNRKTIRVVVVYDADTVDPNVNPFVDFDKIPGVLESYVEIPEPPFHWGSLPESRMPVKDPTA